eukprot:TRINITY_DN13143_c2_g1_i1.p1 TRINITY_DN13143_c2_g1~~TRINITY_DN13143_c2_g1_i1.p1  ORF type:complete len:557 (-),score=144.63 TRINITY_DN13143_c2_g1_i1:81-1751(-)
MDLAAMPNSKKPADFVSVRLQSPAGIRRAARWVNPNLEKEVSGQVTNQGEFLPDATAVPGGLACAECFGEAQQYTRRQKMGFIELAWPCGHVWFSGGGKSGNAARLLGKPVSEVVKIRQFHSDVYLGEWSAAQLHYLTNGSGADFPQVASVGSPVAAALPPQRKKFRVEAKTPEVSSAKTENSGPSLTRKNRLLAKLMEAAVKGALPDNARCQSRALRQALEVVLDSDDHSGASKDDLMQAAASLGNLLAESRRLLAELPQQLAILAENGQPNDTAAEILVDEISSLLAEQASELNLPSLTEEKAKELLLLATEGTEEEMGKKSTASLQSMARENLYKFWKSLVFPGFDDDSEDEEGDEDKLKTKLEELHKDLGQQVEAYDAAAVEATIRKLQCKAQAALDVVLQAYVSESAGQASGTEALPSTSRSRLERYAPEPYDVYWYDPDMAPVAFHAEDVQRQAARIRDQARNPHSSSSSSSNNSNNSNNSNDSSNSNNSNSSNNSNNNSSSSSSSSEMATGAAAAELNSNSNSNNNSNNNSNSNSNTAARRAAAVHATN